MRRCRNAQKSQETPREIHRKYKKRTHPPTTPYHRQPKMSTDGILGVDGRQAPAKTLKRDRRIYHTPTEYPPPQSSYEDAHRPVEFTQKIPGFFPKPTNPTGTGLDSSRNFPDVSKKRTKKKQSRCQNGKTTEKRYEKTNTIRHLTRPCLNLGSPPGISRAGFSRTSPCTGAW